VISEISVGRRARNQNLSNPRAHVLRPSVCSFVYFARPS